MKKENIKIKLILSVVVVIFLVATFVRAQRECIMVELPVCLYRTSISDGATFKSNFSDAKISVVRKDGSSLVTIIREGKTYQYLVEAESNIGITAVNYTDLQSGYLEPVEYSYDRVTHQLTDGIVQNALDYPQDIGASTIIRLGLLDTRSVFQEADELFVHSIIFFVMGFLIILVSKYLSMILCVIADFFFKLEEPLKPRKGMIIAFILIGSILMARSAFILFLLFLL